MCRIGVAVGATPMLRLDIEANPDQQHTRPAASAAGWPDRRVLGGR